MSNLLTSLAQYTRATLNAVSLNSESKWPNYLESQGQWPPFPIPDGFARCIFGTQLVIVTQIHHTLLHRQANFPIILENKNAQMTSKVQLKKTLFLYQSRVSPDAYLVQIRWFQPKSMTSYRTVKPNFLEFWVKMAKITLMTSDFNTRREYLLMPVWWKCGDSSSK